MQTFQLNDEQQTMEFGEMLGEALKPNDIILLNGDLGVGKTTLTKGIAKALGIKRYVKSPTYMIVREYRDGKMPLFHLDAYRLADSMSDEIGLEEYLNGDGVTVIEWPQYVADFLPEEVLNISIDRNDDNTKRFISVDDSKTPRFEEVLQKIEEHLNGF